MVLLPPCTLKRLFSSLVLEAIKKLQFGFLLAKCRADSIPVRFKIRILLISQFDGHKWAEFHRAKRTLASKISSLLANGICQPRSFRKAERIIWGKRKGKQIYSIEFLLLVIDPLVLPKRYFNLNMDSLNFSGTFLLCHVTDSWKLFLGLFFFFFQN